MSLTTHHLRGAHLPHHVHNVNLLEEDMLTVGQRIADAVAHVMGSWKFIMVQSALLFLWVTVNVVGWINEWDPYPFILLNLALSFQAANSAPIIMMSQNRQATKDRLTAEHDYQVNVRAELEVAEIRTKLSELADLQWTALVELQEQQLALLKHIDALTTDVHRMTAAQPSSSPNPPGAQED
jgi:uncharacterized membrane protein